MSPTALPALAPLHAGPGAPYIAAVHFSSVRNARYRPGVNPALAARQGQHAAPGAGPTGQAGGSGLKLPGVARLAGEGGEATSTPTKAVLAALAAKDTGAELDSLDAAMLPFGALSLAGGGGGRGVGLARLGAYAHPQA